MGLVGSCTELSWRGGGEGEQNHCGPLFQTITQHYTKDSPCETLRANVSALKDVAMGSDSSPETHPGMWDLYCPESSRQTKGAGILPGKAVISDVAVLHTRADLEGADSWRRPADPPFTWTSGPS